MGNNKYNGAETASGDGSKKCLFIFCDGTGENETSSASHSTNVALFAYYVGCLDSKGCEMNSGRKDHCKFIRRPITP